MRQGNERECVSSENVLKVRNVFIINEAFEPILVGKWTMIKVSIIYFVMTDKTVFLIKFPDNFFAAASR